MKFAKLAAAAAMAFAALPTIASAEVTVGSQVFGPEGGEVGMVQKIDGNVVYVQTDKHTVPLPSEAFGESDAGPTITVGREQLNQMMDQQLAAAQAQLDAQLVVGNAVVGAQGNALGAITEIVEDNVTIEGDLGSFVLPKNAFALGANGLMAGVTAEQIEAQLSASAEPAAEEAPAG